MDFSKFVKLLSSGSISEISFTGHVESKSKKRNLNKNIIESTLLNRRKALRGIEQQGKNRFKLTYLHPEMDDMDLIIVVDAEERKSKMKLIVVTAFPQPSSRRIRVMDDERG